MKVYIAGPITKGDLIQNVRAAIDAAELLRNEGHFPFVPHLSAFWHLVHAREYEDWMEQDFNWIDSCDALVRLPGESEGADREVDYARWLKIRVFFDVQSFLVSTEELPRCNHCKVRPVSNLIGSIFCSAACYTQALAPYHKREES